MTLHQRRRPTPIQVFATRAKRQGAGIGAVGPGSEGPVTSIGAVSPDSPGSSDDDSDSEDEVSSPKESSSLKTSQASSTSSLAISLSSLPAVTSVTTSTSTLGISSIPMSTTTSIPTSTIPSISTSTISSQMVSSIVKPMSSSSFLSGSTTRIRATSPATTIVTTFVTASPTTLPASPISPTATSSRIFSSKIARPTQPTPTTTSLPPPTSAPGVPVGEDDRPRRTRPQQTIMSKGAEAAAITLSIIGAIALVVGILLYCKRRRRRRDEKLEAELERDAANYAALQRPETAHINTSHLTKSSDRSNTLFGAASYERPQTVSTINNSTIAMPQPTPNPFADPPLNKAYDVLAGRPRSTTLTDRGSWVKNPFKDPESERFDPFGELQAKARRERVKQVELARREAELERQFQEKEKMGLVPLERAVDRKGSGVTLDGLGVLDRSGGGSYR